MKKIILIYTSLAFLSCKAQTIINMNNASNYGAPGFYYKDIDNDFDTFEGTWRYTNVNTSITVNFRKRINMHQQSEVSNYYLDALVGEYKYIENGVEKINTISNLSNNHNRRHDYNLVAIGVEKYGDNSCFNCEPENKLIECSFEQPNCDLNSSPVMFFRYYVENGIEKLHLRFRGGPVTGDPLGIEPQCEGYAIPFGEYTLIKQ